MRCLNALQMRFACVAIADCELEVLWSMLKCEFAAILFSEG
jgi:hypothetical protein